MTDQERTLCAIIGKNLKRTRIPMAITHREMATNIGIAVWEYEGIEDGTIMMTAYQLYQASAYLMVTVPSLLKERD